jgi:prevent-host-death family protein
MVKAAYATRLGESAAPRYRAVSRTFQTAEDIIPVAELKANMSAIVRGLDERPRPLVVTVNGKPAAVVMSPREYDALAYRARFVAAVNQGLAEADAGLTEDGEEALAEILGELPGNKRRRPRAR